MKKEKLITAVICTLFIAAAGVMYIRSGYIGKERVTDVQTEASVESQEGSRAGGSSEKISTGSESLKKSASGNGSNSSASSGVSSQNSSMSGEASQKKSTGEDTGTDKDDSEAEVRVYICGAVKNPGVYSMNPDSRICDVLEKAGGFRKKAFREGVNLAEKISDAEKIEIPFKGKDGKKSGSSEKEGRSNQNISESGSDSHTLAEPEAGTGAGSGTGQGKGSDSSGKVNINTAGKDELLTLTGIGEAKADSIIEYREKNGNFGSTEDIMKISGIKSGVFEKIKDHIYV